MNKRLHEICYLCGQVGAMTQEHIPPKNLAPRSPRSDFTFVPSCSTCNNLYAREEEKFRDLLVLGAAQGIAAADDAGSVSFAKGGDYRSRNRGNERTPTKSASTTEHEGVGPVSK